MKRYNKNPRQATTEFVGKLMIYIIAIAIAMLPFLFLLEWLGWIERF